LPRNITPLGIELDPTTGADLSSNDKKWIATNVEIVLNATIYFLNQNPY
jgi:hypothetical protein